MPDPVTGSIAAVGGLNILGSNVAANKQKNAIKYGTKYQVDALGNAIDTTQQGYGEAMGYLNPFQAVGEQGLSSMATLTDPNAQYEYLQSNPLFQASLDNANQQTIQLAASKGRLSAGDTLQALSNNVMLSAMPLLNQQNQNVLNMLGMGTGVAQNMANIKMGETANLANLETDIGSVRAGGKIGQGNVAAQNIGNITSSIGNMIGGFAGKPAGGNTLMSGSQFQDNIMTGNFNSSDWAGY